MAPKLSGEIINVLMLMESFEATESVPNTGTGARREGHKFEHLIQQLWRFVSDTALSAGAHRDLVKGQGKRYYHKLMVGSRSLLLPTNIKQDGRKAPMHRWLEVSFSVGDLITAFPSEEYVVRKFAPSAGPFSGRNYPKIYHNLKTKFDDTVLLVENDTLIEKILFEYKTAKSSGGDRIDGNVHERLSFQIMQYLEAATRYTKCSFVVITNGAYIKYKNKYHVNFHIQAERLKNFAWFNMLFLSYTKQYLFLINKLLSWLFDDAPLEWERSVD